MLDVDSFKSYNDTYGHPAGDHVLRGVADILSANARATDLVARYGGEEFVLLLPHADIAGAAAVAERIRSEIATASWPLRTVTASLGVTSLLDNDTPATLLDRADASLYRAKAAGRNTVASG
jgi:diguanylate cyclase (GGDEF)-like protein